MARDSAPMSSESAAANTRQRQGGHRNALQTQHIGENVIVANQRSHKGQDMGGNQQVHGRRSPQQQNKRGQNFHQPERVSDAYSHARHQHTAYRSTQNKNTRQDNKNRILRSTCCTYLQQALTNSTIHEHLILGQHLQIYKQQKAPTPLIHRKSLKPLFKNTDQILA